MATPSLEAQRPNPEALLLAETPACCGEALVEFKASALAFPVTTTLP
jgi:hypothetical protein